jgi:hypothetical protein
MNVAREALKILLGQTGKWLAVSSGGPKGEVLHRTQMSASSDLRVPGLRERASEPVNERTRRTDSQCVDPDG